MHQVIEVERLRPDKQHFWCYFSTIFSESMYQSRDLPAVYAPIKWVLYLPPPLKLINFCALSENYKHLFEKQYTHVIANCLRNSKIASNLDRPSGSWVIDLNKILTVLIHDLKTAYPTKIAMPFLSSLNNLPYVAYVIFARMCWLFWNGAQNMLIWGRKCSTEYLDNGVIIKQESSELFWSKPPGLACTYVDEDDVRREVVVSR